MCVLAAYFTSDACISVKFDVVNTINLKVVTVIVLSGTNILGGVGRYEGTIMPPSL